MKDQPSTSDNDDDEPVRFTIPQPSIDEYLVYSEEAGGYIAPGEPSNLDIEAWMREFREEMNNLSEEERRAGLITVDQLRAAGALRVPPAWRKSLGGGKPERDLFSDLTDDDEKPEDEPSAAVEPDIDSEQPTDSPGQA